MNNWLTVGCLNKFFINKFEVGIDYNIEKLSGMRFSKPDVFFSIFSVREGGVYFHVKIVYTINYPNIRFDNIGKDLDKKIIVSAIIFESEY